MNNEMYIFFLLETKCNLFVKKIYTIFFYYIEMEQEKKREKVVLTIEYVKGKCDYYTNLYY